MPVEGDEDYSLAVAAMAEGLGPDGQPIEVRDIHTLNRQTVTHTRTDAWAHIHSQPDRHTDRHTHPHTRTDIHTTGQTHGQTHTPTHTDRHAHFSLSGVRAGGELDPDA